MSCTQCSGIREQFNDPAIAKVLRRYRRRGPDKTTRILIGAIREITEADDVRDATLLDVGAGIGAIHHDLLDGRLQRAIHLDASPAQVAYAREETERRGHGDRVQFVDGDFTALAEQLLPADLVTLDRVICCFDDMPRLVHASAGKARRYWGAVYPRDVSWMRVAIAVINVVQRVKRSTFRVFLHDPRAIDAALRDEGLRQRVLRRTAGWQVVVYERSPTPTVT